MLHSSTYEVNMATPVANRTVPVPTVLSVAHNYTKTFNGANDLMFKPVKVILDIAHYNGHRTLISENVRNLADDAGTGIDIAELYPKLYGALEKIGEICIKVKDWCWKGSEFLVTGFDVGELSAKVSSFAATVFKCLGFLAKKGVSMMDSAILKTWESRFNIVRFGWGAGKAFYALPTAAPTADLDIKKQTLAAIKLVFNGSLLTLTTFGSVISPLSALILSCTVLTSSIGGEFYGKLNNVQLD